MDYSGHLSQELQSPHISLLFSFSEHLLNFSIILFSILSSSLLTKERNAFLRNWLCELTFAF